MSNAQWYDHSKHDVEQLPLTQDQLSVERFYLIILCVGLLLMAVSGYIGYHIGKIDCQLTSTHWGCNFKRVQPLNYS